MEDSSSKEITNEDLALFKDALTGAECDNIELKLHTIKQIATLSKILGPKKTVEELLNHIDSHLNTLEDEVLYSLVEELEQFLPLVGGPDHCNELFTILLRISRSVDENLVRNRAVEAIKSLLSDIDQQLTEKFIVASLVAGGDNIWFSEKCSTLSLIPVCYPKASPENKILLRQKYCQIFDDNSALIRKLAAMGMPEFINVLEIEHVLKEFVPLLTVIAEDEQESVRMSAVDIALSIAYKSKNREIRNDMFEIINKQSQKSSWRIRQKIAMIIHNIAEVFAEEDFVRTILLIYDNLVNDAEYEVRIEAVLNLYNFAQNLHDNLSKIKEPAQQFDEIFVEDLMPIILSITTDESKEVQIAFSSVILSFGLLISDEIFKDTILSIVINGLEKDKPLLFKENILMNLGLLPKDVDLVKSLSSIKSIMKHILLASEASWRTRRSLLVSFVHVSQFCTAEYFQENLLGYYILLLKDNIYAVRRTATIILPILTKRLGVKWVIKEVMPQILELLNSEKYLMRYMILFCIQELIFPTINTTKIVCDNEKYLKHFKILLDKDEKKFGGILCRILHLNQKLRQSFENKAVKDIIDTYTDEYNIGQEDISLYSEELLETITRSDEDIFSIESSSVIEDLCYLEGVLVLLNKSVLNILKNLLEDPTKNVQDRTKYVLTSIKKFSNDLNEEAMNSWVSNYSSQIEEATWKDIDVQVEEEIDSAVIDWKNTQKVDADLIDTTSISIESSATGSNITKIDIPKLEVYPTDRVPSDEKYFEQMGSLGSLHEERSRDSKC